MPVVKQHGFTALSGNYPAYANVSLHPSDDKDHEHNDRVVLSVRSAKNADGSEGALGVIEFTRQEFVDFVEKGLETLSP